MTKLLHSILTVAILDIQNDHYLHYSSCFCNWPYLSLFGHIFLIWQYLPLFCHVNLSGQHLSF